jgi:hypothetical protein
MVLMLVPMLAPERAVVRALNLVKVTALGMVRGLAVGSALVWVVALEPGLVLAMAPMMARK